MQDLPVSLSKRHPEKIRLGLTCTRAAPGPRVWPGTRGADGIDAGSVWVAGGGFRDSLTDISEELCPSSGDGPVPLPFFIRTSNQVP